MSRVESPWRRRCGPAAADTFGSSSGGPAFQPSVPISALARPMALLDPTRFHVTSSFSVGSGFGGSQALSVTSFSYQFRAPAWLQLSVGNQWGGVQSGKAGSPFLEGVELGFRPTSNMMVKFQYHDFRSQLQNPNYFSDSPYWGR